jgi:hypothetical protein
MALGDHDQTRLALAGLFVALARTLGEKDESFPSRFDKNVERVYREMEDDPNDPLGAMEALMAAHEMLRVRGSRADR